jgi:hypothetical protein
MTVQVTRSAGATPRKVSATTAATTTAGPDGSSVHIADGLFTGYDDAGNFFAQIDTSTEDDNGMPIMKVVTANGTSATVNFPDISTISPGVPWAFSFQGDDYSLLLSRDYAGNVQLLGPGGTTTSITNVGGDRVYTDPNGKQFTLPGDEIDRMGGTLFASTAVSAPASAARAARQVAQQPVGGGPPGQPGQPPPFPPPGQAGPCTPQQITNCENLRDAIFALFIMALAAIALVGIGCVIAAWFAAAICTIGVAVALAAATAMMLRSVRLFNFGVCGKVCHIYA